MNRHQFATLLQDRCRFGLFMLLAMAMHFILGAFFAGLFCMRGAAAPAIYETVKSKLTTCTNGLFAPC